MATAKATTEATAERFAKLIAKLNKVQGHTGKNDPQRIRILRSDDEDTLREKLRSGLSNALDTDFEGHGVDTVPDDLFDVITELGLDEEIEDDEDDEEEDVIEFEDDEESDDGGDTVEEDAGIDTEDDEADGEDEAEDTEEIDDDTEEVSGNESSEVVEESERRLAELDGGAKTNLASIEAALNSLLCALAEGRRIVISVESEGPAPDASELAPEEKGSGDTALVAVTESGAVNSAPIEFVASMIEAKHTPKMRKLLKTRDALNDLVDETKRVLHAASNRGVLTDKDARVAVVRHFDIDYNGRQRGVSPDELTARQLSHAIGKFVRDSVRTLYRKKHD